MDYQEYSQENSQPLRLFSANYFIKHFNSDVLKITMERLEALQESIIKADENSNTQFKMMYLHDYLFGLLEEDLLQLDFADVEETEEDKKHFLGLSKCQKMSNDLKEMLVVNFPLMAKKYADRDRLAKEQALVIRNRVKEVA